MTPLSPLAAGDVAWIVSMTDDFGVLRWPVAPDFDRVTVVAFDPESGDYSARTDQGSISYYEREQLLTAEDLVAWRKLIDSQIEKVTQ
jgi:hypothetical protein